MRSTYRISTSHYDRLQAFTNLADKNPPPKHGKAAWEVWKEIAEKAGVDYRTIRPAPEKLVLKEGHDKRWYWSWVPGSRWSFTALPLRHEKKDWCWPLPLKCKKSHQVACKEWEEFELAHQRSSD